MPIIGTCCCGGTPVSCCPPTCQVPVNVPREWLLTVAGVANAACTSCIQYNGDFVLRWGGICSWADFRSAPPACAFSQPFSPNCFWNFTWDLHRDTQSDNYLLEPNTFNLGAFGQNTRYMRAFADWNCNADNVMVLDRASGECNGYPATLTVRPGAVLTPRCQCDPPFDALAVRWQFTLNGLTGCCAEEMNTTVILQPDPAADFARCAWEAKILTDCPPPPPGDDRNVYFLLRYGFIPGWLVLFITMAGNNAMAYYRMPFASFNPVGLNIMTRDIPTTTCAFGSLDICGGFPNQIELVPA